MGQITGRSQARHGLKMEAIMALTVNWPGRSGNPYPFETHPIGTEFRPYSGVYIACKSGNSVNWDALYVGETKSFFDRLNAGFEDHDGLKCARRNGATHIGVMIVSSDAERLRIETELRHSLRPPCNRQSVSSIATILARR